VKAGTDGMAGREERGETQSCGVTHGVAEEEHGSASPSILPEPL
jgi:hypothetical protein